MHYIAIFVIAKKLIRNHPLTGELVLITPKSRR